MNNTYCVYMHTSPSGKRYIGITGQKPKDRWKNGNGYKNNTYFKNAVKKYGWENIEHTILFSSLDKKDACRLEQICIMLFKSNDRRYGYNRSIGGENSSLGVVKTQEEKNQISIRTKRYYDNNPEAKISKSIEYSKRCKDNPEIRKWLSFIASEGAKKYMKPVYCYETDLVYSCARTAGEELGIKTIEHIRACCTGGRKSAGGYHFCHVEERKMINYDNNWC